MKALIYNGPGKTALENRPKPEIAAPTDAIVRISKTTICGTDLHIIKGDVPTCGPGRILGHEGVGIIDTGGSAVTSFKKGDHVLISRISACGKCDYCRRQIFPLHHGGLDYWASDRRHAGRVRAHAACRPEP